ncbi:MAG: ATP-grasp domain-containing protein [Rhizomicrobium sp.]
MAHIGFVEASITGAGRLAIEFAKAAGHQVTFLSRDPGSYDRYIPNLGDRVVVVETNDPARLTALVARLHRENPFHGITTTADFHVPQAAAAAQRLGLPGLTFEGAMNARNKYRMRELLQRRHPHLNPRYLRVIAEEDVSRALLEVGVPCVAKPLNNNNGNCVKRIETESQLRDYWTWSTSWTTNSAKQKLEDGFLVEALILGMEVSVETVQPYRGGRQLIGVTGKTLTGVERGHFVEAAHCFPFEAADVGLIYAGVSDCLDALDVTCGVIHTECRIAPSGVKIIEVNPRLAGGKIGSHLVEIATGNNPVQHVIDIALGEAAPWTPKFAKGAAIRYLSAPRAGRFLGLENEAELRTLAGVTDVFILKEPGEAVTLPEANEDRLVSIVAEGADAQVALQRVDDAAARARLRID